MMRPVAGADKSDATLRYFLFGGVAIVAAVGLIGWHFFGGRGEVLN
jgi:hypothetical protein